MESGWWFSNIVCHFHPYLGEVIIQSDSYFFGDGLKPPTRNVFDCLQFVLHMEVAPLLCCQVVYWHLQREFLVSSIQSFGRSMLTKHFMCPELAFMACTKKKRAECSCGRRYEGQGTCPAW